MTKKPINPAEESAKKALIKMCSAIDRNQSFLFEAGAGSGKTYSLKYALKYLIDKRGSELIKKNQQIACISYTNFASEQILLGTDNHPVIYSSTIHAFCWMNIQNFQPVIRDNLNKIDKWDDKIEEAGGIKNQIVKYERGYRKIDGDNIFLHHDDVLTLFVTLMEFNKFRNQIISRFPIIFIDEYQDTDINITQAIKTHFLETGEGPLIGYFGDHWQKIYGSSCGKIDHPALELIGKESNFRSVPSIVNVLNKMRPELPQQVIDPDAEGSVAIYHTNSWKGPRETKGHWKGDLPSDIAHIGLQKVKDLLNTDGWDFSPELTKILMLTHKVLAREQGYANIEKVFPYNDSFIKKEDPHVAFLIDILEPVCNAYLSNHFGEMFAQLGTRTPTLRSHQDKISWTRDMNKLIDLRFEQSIGEVLDYLLITKRPRLTERIEEKENELSQWKKDPNRESSSTLEQLEEFRKIPYSEIIALFKYLNNHTPFETKHGVKGAEFENILVVIGRGWNHYNFNQFLEWSNPSHKVPSNKQETYERNRNLFYVSCSRPIKRLAILFTQELTPLALDTLNQWFGKENIHSLTIE